MSEFRGRVPLCSGAAIDLKGKEGLIAILPHLGGNTNKGVKFAFLHHEFKKGGVSGDRAFQKNFRSLCITNIPVLEGQTLCVWYRCVQPMGQHHPIRYLFFNSKYHLVANDRGKVPKSPKILILLITRFAKCMA